jgi:hypothetical protein
MSSIVPLFADTGLQSPLFYMRHDHDHCYSAQDGLIPADIRCMLLIFHFCMKIEISRILFLTLNGIECLTEYFLVLYKGKIILSKVLIQLSWVGIVSALLKIFGILFCMASNVFRNLKIN